MRFILLVILLAFAILYATIGVRFGFLPDIPMSYWNAEGTNTYPISVRINNASINVNLDATINQGRTVIDLIAPNGVIIWQRKLEAGRVYQETQRLSVADAGFYRMVVQFERSSGRLNLSWQLFGNF